MRKVFLWGIPIFIIFASSVLFYFKQLDNIIQLPREGWSRSISLPMKNLQHPPYVIKKDDVYEVYGNIGGEVKFLRINDHLEVLEEKVLPVEIGKESKIWMSENGHMLFSKNSDLFYYKSDSLNQVANNINGYIVSQKGLYYHKNNTVYFTNGIKTIEISTFNADINWMAANNRSSDLLVVIDEKKTLDETVYYLSKQNSKYIKSRFMVIEKYPGLNVSDFDFVTVDNKILVTYKEIDFSAGGGVEYKYKYFIKNDKISVSENIKPLQIENPKGYSILQPFNLELMQMKDNIIILFSAEGELPYSNHTINLYKGHLNKGKVVALRQNTNIVAKHGFWIDDSIVGWLGHQKGYKYQLYVSSSHPKVIKQSLEATPKDYKLALNNALLKLSKNFLVVILGTLFVLPAILYLGMAYLINITAVERQSNKIWWPLMSVFTVGWFCFIHFYIASGLIQNKLPIYLKFPFSIYIFGVLVFLLAYWLGEKFKHEDWGLAARLFYIVFVNMFVFSFIFGQYTA